jgi:hypothetical protein
MNRTIASSVALLLLATPTLADSIDGDWCSPQGKHLTIHGPEITTPNRTTIQGTYRRHEFAYTSPAGDADAGTQNYLGLLNEEELNFYTIGKDGQPGDPVLWKRCEVTS